MNRLAITMLSIVTVFCFTFFQANDAPDNQLYLCQFMFTDSNDFSKRFMLADAKEWIKHVCTDEAVNELYKKLSWGEQRTFRKFWEKTIKLWSKVREEKIGWEAFVEEAITILKPYETMAKKFAEKDRYIFSIAIGSKYGIWRIYLGQQWPQGFGVVIQTEIQVYYNTPSTVDTFMASLCKKDPFASYYATLSIYEQNQIQEFAQGAINLYGRVNAGFLNHVEFQDEARELLQTYEVLAKKIATDTKLSIFSVTVAMDFNGQPASLRIEYGYGYDGEFKVMCCTTIEGQQNSSAA